MDCRNGPINVYSFTLTQIPWHQWHIIPWHWNPKGIWNSILENIVSHPPQSILYQLITRRTVHFCPKPRISLFMAFRIYIPDHRPQYKAMPCWHKCSERLQCCVQCIPGNIGVDYFVLLVSTTPNDSWYKSIHILQGCITGTGSNLLYTNGNPQPWNIQCITMTS